MSKNIIIPNPKHLGKIKKEFSKYGAKRIYVISDFERTLTKIFVNKKYIPSLISILSNDNYLTLEYTKKAQQLYNKYRPIENDQNISHDKKRKLMHEWWSAHFKLLIKSKLNKKDLDKLIESRKLKFRDGVPDFIDFLHKRNIPLIIISSCGLGTYAISIFLKREVRSHDNICIISNSFKWDENGYAIGLKKPIIHSMNKDETQIRNLPVFNKIKNRKNVILLGDNLEDVNMAKALDYNNIIKIAFLNENIEEDLERYKKNYDIIITNDSSFEYVNKLLKEIIS